MEVTDAHNLMPKDSSGSASVFVLVHFENQLNKAVTVHKNLKPHLESETVLQFRKLKKLPTPIH